jgi:hypothetical protein
VSNIDNHVPTRKTKKAGKKEQSGNGRNIEKL